MNKILGFSKRLLSVILCCTLLLASLPVLVASASENSSSYTRLYDLNEVTKLYLSENEKTISEYPNGAFMIPLASAELKMKDTYALEIFREGGVKGDASITLKTIDLTAGYGEDYEIFTSLAEKAVKGQANRYYDIENYSFIATRTQKDTVYATNEGDDVPFVRNATSQYNDELLKSMPVSSELTLDFKDGENSKTIYIRTYKKREVTDNLQFTLNLCEPKNASIGAQISTAFTILEEREKPDTYLSIKDTSVNPESEEAYITVKRTGNMGTTGTFTVTTKPATAQTGIAYEPQQMNLTFTPGMSEIKVPVTLLDKAKDDTYFEAVLDDITVAKSKPQTAKISITSKAKKEAKHETALTRAGIEVSSTSELVNKNTGKRGVQIVDVSKFKIEHQTDRGAGWPEGYWESDSDGMVIKYDNNWSSLNNAVSVRSPEKIDFTGVSQIVMHQKNISGSVAEDDGMFYVADKDLFDNSSSNFDFAESIDSKIGTSWGMVNISSTYNRTANLDANTVMGDHYLYIAMHRTGCVGHGGFTVYNKGTSDVDKNVRLMLRKYNISVIEPQTEKLYIGGSLQTQEVIKSVDLVNPAASGSASTNTGKSFDIYRDETTALSYDIDSKYNNLVKLKGVYFCTLDDKGNISSKSELYSMNSDSLTLTSSILETYKDYITDNNIVIQPVFNLSDVSSFSVESYDNQATGQRFDANSGNFYMNDELIGKISWTQSARDSKNYKVSDELIFTFTKESSVKNNFHFKLDYRYAPTESLLQSATKFTAETGTNQIQLTLSDLYVSVTPVITLVTSDTMLRVKNPSMGDFLGKGSKYATTNADGTVTLNGYSDGKDEVIFNKLVVGQIVTFSATPANGYRAKWTYTNSSTHKIQTYYGNSFFYMVQNPYTDTDNTVVLDFVEKSADAKDINISGVTLLQEGSIINKPTADTDTYKTISGALVMLSQYSTLSNTDGTFTLDREISETENAAESKIEREPVKISVSKDEVHRALTYYNNQYYITDINMADYLSNDTGINVDLKLDYKTTGVQPISIDCVSADGTTYQDSITLTSGIAVQFNLWLDTKGQDPDHPVNMVRWTVENENGVKSTYDIEMEANTTVSHWANTLSEIIKAGDRLCVEPMWRHELPNDDEHKYEYTSYGKWDTGYTFNASSAYETITYAPDIGAPVTMVQPNPVLGPVSPTVSIKGFTPILNTGTIGVDKNGREIHTITIGVSFSECSDRASENKEWETYTPLDKALALGDILDKYDTAINNNENPSFAGGKKLVNALSMKTTVYLSFSFLLAYQGNYYVDDSTGEWNFVGNLLVAGAGGSIRVSIPFVLCYIPCFAYFNAGINVNIYMGVYGLEEGQTNKIVALTLDQLDDANACTFQGVYQLHINLGVGVGIGFDALLNASGGVNFDFDIQFNNFLEGYGTFDMTGEIALELLFLRAAWSGNIVSAEMFDTLGDHNDIDMASLQSQIETDIMNDITLSDMTIATAQITDNVMAPLTPQHEEKLVEKTTTGTDPEIISIGNERYLIVTATTDEDGKHNILHYYIYDEPSDQIVECDAVLNKYQTQLKARDDSILSTLSQDYQRIDSAVTLTDCGEDILIAWNKCTLDNSSEIHELFKSVGIATIFYNKESGTFHDYKLMSDETGKNIYLAPKVVYNANTGVIQMFYQVMNVEDITKDSTLQDIQQKRTALMTCVYTNEDFSDAEPVSINRSFLKYYDVTAFGNDIMLSYVASEYPGFTLEDTKDIEMTEEYAQHFAKTPNALYIVNFEMQEGTLVHSKPVKISRDDTVNANPKFVTVNTENINDTLLFFKSDGVYAYQNISDIMQNASISDVGNELLLNDVHAAPQYINSDEDYTVNDDLEVFANTNGDIYALWTTTEGDCQQIWAKQFVFTGVEETFEISVPSGGSDYTTTVLENPRHSLQGYWGGKTYLTEEDVLSDMGYYKEDFTATVLENGDILAVYNAFDKEITNEGSNKINNMLVIGEYDTDSSYIGAKAENEICFSNDYPSKKDTIEVSVRASNQGVKTGQNVDVTLYADGKAVDTKREELWLSTEHKVIDFFYTLPENATPSEIDFYYTISENGEFKYKSESFNLLENHSLDLVVKTISPLGVYSKDNNKVKFFVHAKVKNNGNVDYKGNSFVKLVFFDSLELCEAMEDGYKAEKPVYTAFGREEIEPLKVGEERDVIFVSDAIDEKYFDITGTGSAYLQCIVESGENSNWKTRNADEKMSVVCEFFPGLTKKPVAKSVESIKLSDIKVKAGSQQKLNVSVSPASALATSKISYSSSNENVATVNEAGVVTGIRAGESTITAQINGVKTTATVKISGDALIGDVDRDGYITIMDVTLIQKHLAKSENLGRTQLLLSDADGDDRISIFDATLIQRYVARYSETERVSEKITIK